MDTSSSPPLIVMPDPTVVPGQPLIVMPDLIGHLWNPTARSGAVRLIPYQHIENESSATTAEAVGGTKRFVCE